MADFEASLLAYLIAQSGIKAVFGSSNTRIYIDKIDERITPTYPFAIIRTVDETVEYAHDGELADSELMQIDVYSTSKTTANSGTLAIRNELSGLTGTMGSVTIGSAFVVDTRGVWNPDARVFLRSLDVQFAQNA